MIIILEAKFESSLIPDHFERVIAIILLFTPNSYASSESVVPFIPTEDHTFSLSFETESHCLALDAWNSLCKSSWSQTHKDLPASVSR